MSNNRLKTLRRVIYRLKRTYGLPVDLYKTNPGTTNLQTGEKTATQEVVRVRRAIVQPARFHRDFVYDLAFISANKDFTTGGFFDTGDRRVIIDAYDLPKGWEPTLNQHVIIGGERYEVRAFNEYEAGMGYILTVRETKGQRLVRLEEVSNVMTLEQGIEVA
jgi:hypothetical protein